VYAQPTHLYDKAYKDKYLFIDSIERNALTNVTSAEHSAITNQIEQWAEDSEDEELSVMLQLELYKLQSGTWTDTTQIERHLEELLEEHSDNKYLHTDILQTLGKFYLDVRRKNSHAFEYYLMAYKEYKNFSVENFPQKRDYIYDLAGAYYRYEDFPNAIRYMSEALSTPHRQQDAMVLTMNNTIGLSYKELKKYDSALLYFNKAYENAKKNKDAVWTGILSGNIGEVYYLQKNSPGAINKLNECISICLANGVKRNAVMAACRLTGIYLEQNNISAAEYTLNRIINHTEINAFGHGNQVNQRLYAVIARLNAAKGNTGLAYLYADSALRAKDSAHAELTEINKVRAAEKAEYVQYKLELSHVAQEKQRQFFVRNFLIVVIILVILIGLLFLNRQRLRHKKLVAELDVVTNKLINLRANETKPEHHPEDEGEIDHDALSKLENATLLTNEQWDEFRKLFDKVHKGFLNNLRRKRPDLTPADIRFIALTKLRLSSKEMASMLGVSPGTIRIYKFRLRKKLGLDKEDIEDFINKL
jgi:DNA-binding CsgD family transcriptional regulator